MFWMEYLGQGMDPLLPALTLVSWASQRYVLYLNQAVTLSIILSSCGWLMLFSYFTAALRAD